MRDLSDLADTLIAQRLSTVTGVGHVNVEGGVRPAVRIEADVSRLAGYGLSMSDLSSAIVSAPPAVKIQPAARHSLDGMRTIATPIKRKPRLSSTYPTFSRAMKIPCGLY